MLSGGAPSSPSGRGTRQAPPTRLAQGQARTRLVIVRTHAPAPICVCLKNGASESTPAEKEWNHETDGSSSGQARSSSAGEAGGIQSSAEGRGRTASSPV
jgi:hypothetical protein